MIGWGTPIVARLLTFLGKLPMGQECLEEICAATSRVTVRSTNAPVASAKADRQRQGWEIARMLDKELLQNFMREWAFPVAFPNGIEIRLCSPQQWTET